MSRKIAVLFVVVFAVLLTLDFASQPDASLTAVTQSTQAQPAEFTGLAYLPLVLVERGQAELVVVPEDQVDDLVRVDRPVKIEKPITDPCDSRNDSENNPDPHPCPKRNSGKAAEHQAPWPAPEPSPEQPKAHQQQQTGGKRGK